MDRFNVPNWGVEVAKLKNLTLDVDPNDMGYDIDLGLLDARELALVLSTSGQGDSST
jgi:hypothetical protein